MMKPTGLDSFGPYTTPILPSVQHSDVLGIACVVLRQGAGGGAL